MQILFSGAFSLLALVVEAQFHVVNDSDGFVNVRREAGTKGKIICRLNNGMIVRESWSEDTLHKNWVYVEFYISKKEAQQIKQNPESEERYPAAKLMSGYLFFTGYIYKDRLINIEKQKELKKKWEGTSFLLYNDSVKIKFFPGEFQKEKHNIVIKDDYPVIKIDGHYLTGTDGGIPKEEIKKISIEINHINISIPKSSYHDLYEPNFNRFTNGYVGQDGTIYITMYNSDAAGSYEVIFIIKHNKYFGRYVFDGEC